MEHDISPQSTPTPTPSPTPTPMPDPDHLIHLILRFVPGSPSGNILTPLWKSAHKSRHIALSLVGESLLYPQINELILDLHRRKLSTFLVSNSQLPEKLKAIPPVTQLYLSVDAADPDTLAEIDRPYVGKTDAWRRLNETIRIIVIKKLNCRREDIPGYVKLIRLGRPCFIELKAFSFVDQCVEYARWLEAVLEGDYSVVSVHHESKAVLIVLMVLIVHFQTPSYLPLRS
ncbi:S-adenosyl-L-methionine-dependent tRNA 4-demethylwyosine synthase like protein [Aduncisulcus paluster]|uniref:S-adenosyl-L-methionine-dependent tRNA 4-demethylwyosine synthase like protein n=1 Tax=Aduncisulcus paluster TaxID=2918883 RepID=A0ABQ5KAC8_9EUKA|nr:S-adenosyl-L-methionine-dependent tRNA 4-demethylwyosine synthase like protein [Aduncisulcus paluster]